MAFDFDLFVIGAGSGGVRAARMSAQAGARVAIAEQSRVGGTCVIRGCVPKKLFVYASEFGEALEHSRGYGWSHEGAEFSWPVLRDNVAAEVDRLNGLYKQTLDRHKVTLFEQRAVIKDPHTVTLVDEGRDVTAEKILITAGGTPTRDDVVDPDRVGIVSDDVFDLDTFPKRIVVVGGGYIAIEFAHIFAGLGAETTLVYRGPQLLRAFDEAISARVESDLTVRGIRYLPNTSFTEMSKTDDGTCRIVTNTGESLEADQCLWAIGRTPMTTGLGLEEAGIETDRVGAIKVDEYNCTSVPSIFALGDVTNRVNLTPVAIREGVAFANTQFGNKPTTYDYQSIPKAVFAQPPVGTVGMSEAEALGAGHTVDIYESDFRPMKNILAGSDERMLLKLIVDQPTQKVLGCHIVGEAAGELIQLVGIAVRAGLTKDDFDATCAVHPTAAEELVTLNAKRTVQP